MSEQGRTNYSDVETRRSPASTRRMSPARRVYYFIGMPILWLALRLMWRSYRVQKVIGADIAERLVASGSPCGPCYWHQYHILCTSMIGEWIRRGFKAAFLISASVDGEVPARIARRWGAEVIRGSANQTGALVLRDMREMTSRGISIVTTADGPSGPNHEFKAGAILMARIMSLPLVPVACAADRAWYLDRWDHFMIPKPFARVVLAVGEPIVVPPDAPLDNLEEYRGRMQDAVNRLVDESNEALRSKRGTGRA